jgi:protein SCO1/2
MQRHAFPWWRWLSLSGVIAVGTILLVLYFAAPLAKIGADLSASPPVRPYQFVPGDGRIWVARTAFRDNPSAIVFGSTRCGVPCAMTLQRLSDALASLGDEGGRLNVLFISTEPTRDTPTVLKDYLAPYDHRIVGLTGAAGATEALADAYFRRFAASSNEQARLQGGDHLTRVFLLEKDGDVMGLFDAREPTEVLRQKLAELIAAD